MILLEKGDIQHKAYDLARANRGDLAPSSQLDERIREYGIQRDRRSAIAEIADIADLTGQMSGAAKKPIPPEWSEIGDGPIVAWSVGVEKKGERFKLRFRGTVLDAEEESGKRPIRSVSRLS